MEFIWVTEMDQVIAAAILLDEEQVDGIAGDTGLETSAQESTPDVSPPAAPLPFGSDVVTDAKPAGAKKPSSS
jgi:hypothetical protein